jgi:pyridoxal phosphate enzyme (YggS family)
MSVATKLESFNHKLQGTGCKLVAVTKTKPTSIIMEAYNTGFKRFGENRVQELKEKYDLLPGDIEWHMIGHLQTNKVKVIAPFVSMIHAVDSVKLAGEINRQAGRNHRIIPCLLQVHIAIEESKYGFDGEELIALIRDGQLDTFENLKIAGLMGMATYTEDQTLIRKEFKKLNELYHRIKSLPTPENFDFQELSMGMSNDYQIAIDEGSTMIRVGSSIFGSRGLMD